MKPTETFSLKKAINKISKNDEHIRKGKEEGNFLLHNSCDCFYQFLFLLILLF
jgi:hypothetical protein